MRCTILGNSETSTNSWEGLRLRELQASFFTFHQHYGFTFHQRSYPNEQTCTKEMIEPLNTFNPQEQVLWSNKQCIISIYNLDYSIKLTQISRQFLQCPLCILLTTSIVFLNSVLILSRHVGGYCCFKLLINRFIKLITCFVTTSTLYKRKKKQFSQQYKRNHMYLR